MKKLFHFLGGVTFAILLITCVTVLVILGTVVESRTESHRFAAQLTYGNPVFIALLWGFFINILFAALRRWPFKVRHIPFLITHLGLLMILGGALIKNYWGTQGTMTVLEGSGTQKIVLPETFAIHVETNDALRTAYDFPIRRTWNGGFETLIADGNLKIEMLEYYPHAHEHWESWFKDDHVHVSGLKPFAAHKTSTPIPVSSRVTMPGNQIWELLALRSDDIENTAIQAYTEGMAVSVRDPVTQKILFQGTLQEALSSFQKIKLHFRFSPILGIEDSRLIVEHAGQQRTILLSITDEHTSYLGQGPLIVELQRQPRFVWIQDSHGDVYLFAFDPWGRIFADTFRRDNLNTLVVYDQGFGGYAIQAKIPYRKENPRECERQRVKQISRELLSHDLSPPLQAFKQACEQVHADFLSYTEDFLLQWNDQYGWLWNPQITPSESIEKALAAMQLPPTEYKAALWASALFQDLEENPYDQLKNRGWPLLDALEPYRDDPIILLTALSRQLLAVADHLPDAPFAPVSPAVQFSFLLRAYGIHPGTLDVPLSPIDYWTLETPLTTLHSREAPLIKIEERAPLITMKISEGSQTDYITLVYDRFGNGLQWPALGGKYRLRFQPTFKNIPYRIRLRQGRQINYPNTQQPYSYESDVYVTDLKRGEITPKTLSMNNVHETWDGYRFYMASLSPAVETAAKRVHIAVNHDPAKYLLTYPGAIILTLGIALLFWARKRH